MPRTHGGKHAVTQDLRDDLADYFDDAYDEPYEDYAIDHDITAYFSDSPYNDDQYDYDDLDADDPNVENNSAISTTAFESLFHDVYRQYWRPSKLIGHALIDVTSDDPTAMQFTPPPYQNQRYPKITPLNNISLFKHDEHWMARGTAEDGTQMLARRSVDIKIKDRTSGEKHQYQLLFFSPAYNQEGEPIPLGNLNKAPLFNANQSKKALKRKALLSNSPVVEKGGKVKINKHHIPIRADSKRHPSQKKVMHKSALKAYSDFYHANEDILSDEMKDLIEDAIESGITQQQEQKKPEWLHAIGHRLSPLTFNPQQKNNLAGGNHCANTDMNITEKVLVFHALHCRGEKQSLNAKFKMLPESDLLDEGTVKGKIKNSQYTVRIKQTISPWIISPNYPTIADTAQTALVTESLLHDIEATRTPVKKCG